MDLSELDKKYFIDEHIYNCPFCKRNNVAYSLINYFDFDWTNDKKCYGYLVRCDSCEKESLHWSWKNLRQHYVYDTVNNKVRYLDSFSDDIDLDSNIFYSRPTSSFTLDENIPKSVRELLLEAEQSLQANLLTGGSACLRKSIYELIKHEEVVVMNAKNSYTDYPASIKNIKTKFEFVDAGLIDALSEIQELSCDPLHEGSWGSWDSKKLKFLIELTKSILDEIYVIPNMRKNRIAELSKLKQAFSKSKTIK